MQRRLRGDDVISDVIKNAVYRQRRTLNKSFTKETLTVSSQC